MALVDAKLYKTVIGVDTPVLRADPGEAFIVKNIMTRDPGSDYITVKIEKTTVGFFRVGGPLGNHLPFRRGVSHHSHTIRTVVGAATAYTKAAQLKDGAGNLRPLALMADGNLSDGDYDEVRPLMVSGFHRNETILKYLEGLGIFTGFPVAEGETLIIEGTGTTANSIVMIEYERWEPGDIKSDAPNGSKSKEFFYINYGNCGAAIKAAGDHLYTVSANPAEFPDFPFGRVVPAKYSVDILGILGSPFAPKENDGTDYSCTKFLKFIKDREVLFDEDRRGLLFYARSPEAMGAQDMVAEGFTMIGNCSENDNNPPLMFPTPLTFISGDELSIFVTLDTGGNGQDIDIYEHELGLIMSVKRVE